MKQKIKNRQNLMATPKTLSCNFRVLFEHWNVYKSEVDVQEPKTKRIDFRANFN